MILVVGHSNEKITPEMAEDMLKYRKNANDTITVMT